MAISGNQEVDNFNVIACADALAVLTEDAYFQDLPANWVNIIHKIKDKLSHKEQSARFNEHLCSLALTSEHDIRSSLPEAIKHLIAALHNSALPSAVSCDLKLEFGRGFTPHALNSKMPRQQYKSSREEERPEERSRHRLMPVVVN